MRASERMMHHTPAGLARVLLAAALLLGASPAHAWDEERDAWMSRDEPTRPRATRTRDPLDYTRANATGNDREPLVARGPERLLHDAVLRGERELVRQLLAVGVNPNRPTTLPFGARPLVSAVERGDVEMVRVLLEGGADPDLRGHGFTALGKAAMRGHARIARMLLAAGAQPDLKGADGNTPLFLAARFDHVDTVRALLDGGADVRVTSRGFTEPMPAFDLFIAEQRPHFARFDLRLHDYDGLTPLGVAALENSLASLRVLLERGADANFRDRGKLPPIFYAIYRQHRAATDLLLAHGADPGALRVNF